MSLSSSDAGADRPESARWGMCDRGDSDKECNGEGNGDSPSILRRFGTVSRRVID